MISVGPTVDELLAQPSSPDWASSSIELCGGTHVTNTADAADFALVTEEAVAKGVRRVVGLTGNLAVNAIAEGATLQGKVSSWRSCDDTSSSEQLESARSELVQLRADVDASVTSVHVKAKLRDELASRDKQVLKLMKQLAQRSVDLAAVKAVDDATAAAAAGESYLVVQIDGLDGKGLQPLVKKVQNAAPGLAVLVLSVDTSAEKVFALASVPGELQEALPANSWLKTALDAVGGRGGGKAASAQGSGADVAAVGTAVQAATSFASSACSAASA